MPQTPKQKRQAAGRMLARKQPASPGVKQGEVVLSASEARRIQRLLEK